MWAMYYYSKPYSFVDSRIRISLHGDILCTRPLLRSTFKNQLNLVETERISETQKREIVYKSPLIVLRFVLSILSASCKVFLLRQLISKWAPQHGPKKLIGKRLLLRIEIILKNHYGHRSIALYLC